MDLGRPGLEGIESTRDRRNFEAFSSQGLVVEFG